MVSQKGNFQGNATAHTLSPDGTSYAVSTTTRYGYKPVSSTRLLVVAPQSTEATTPTKTPEQLQQEAEQNGWVSPPKLKFSWSYPWFWLETTVTYPSLSFGFVTCVSLFDGWLQDYYGFENPLYKIFEGVTPQQVDVLTSVAIASITTAAATFVGGYILLLLQSGNVFGSFLVQVGYLVAGLAIIVALSSMSDTYQARAALIAMGWTLLAIATFGLIRVLPVLLSKFTGTDPVTASIKTILNTLLGVAISTSILKALKVNLSQFIFYIANLVLGIAALSQGYSKI